MKKFTKTFGPKKPKTKPQAQSRRPPSKREIKRDLREIKNGIKHMATITEENVQQLRDLASVIGEIQSGVDKVTTEVDRTLAKVQELERAIAGEADPAVTELLVQLRNQVTRLKETVTAADDRIPDASEIPVPVPEPVPPVEPPATPPIETADTGDHRRRSSGRS